MRVDGRGQSNVVVSEIRFRGRYYWQKSWVFNSALNRVRMCPNRVFERYGIVLEFQSRKLVHQRNVKLNH
jgi:hypothetical protein